MSESIPKTPEEYRQWWETNTDVPYGYCWCGCGQRTNLARQRDTRLKYFRGEPARYRRGHGNYKGISKSDYCIEDHGYETPCWIWKRYVATNGYGVLYERNTKKILLAHRVFYEAHKEAIPLKMVIDHLCRIPSCVNPDHLEVVTVATNTRRGKLARLTTDDVAEIRRLWHENKTPQGAIAFMYGVTENHVSDIICRRRWK